MPQFTLHSLDMTVEVMRTSAIRRIGYERWLRNIAIALGNSEDSASAITALKARHDDPSALVREHVTWALDQQQSRLSGGA